MLKRIRRMHGDATGLRGDVSGLYGDATGLRGDVSGIWGDATGLRGDGSGLRGDATGIWGDLDDCHITEEARNKGIDVNSLIEDE